MRENVITGRERNKAKLLREMPLYAMLIPAVAVVFIYSYIPMAGIVIAFQRFVPTKGLFGSAYIGFANFKTLFSLPDTWQVIGNTVFLSVFKMIGGIIAPVVFALLLNEISQKKARQTFQTMVYLPNFLSWITAYFRLPAVQRRGGCGDARRHYRCF